MKEPSVSFSLRRWITKPRFRRLARLVRMLWRPFPETVYRFFDRRFDRIEEAMGGLTFDPHELRRNIDAQVINCGVEGQIAPHSFTVFMPYSKVGSDRDTETLISVVHATCIDYINDKFYRTLDRVTVRGVADIYGAQSRVEASFGDSTKTADTLRRKHDDSRHQQIIANEPLSSVISLRAYLSAPGFDAAEDFKAEPGGTSISVGSAEGNDLVIGHFSVAPRHATLSVTSDGTIQVADLASSSGTFVNRIRVPNSHVRSVKERRDTVTFGKVKVRFKRLA